MEGIEEIAVVGGGTDNGGCEVDLDRLVQVHIALLCLCGMREVSGLELLGEFYDLLLK
jgi:hypothetical protein